MSSLSEQLVVGGVVAFGVAGAGWFIGNKLQSIGEDLGSGIVDAASAGQKLIGDTAQSTGRQLASVGTGFTSTVTVKRVVPPKYVPPAPLLKGQEIEPGTGNRSIVTSQSVPTATQRPSPGRDVYVVDPSSTGEIRYPVMNTGFKLGRGFNFALKNSPVGDISPGSPAANGAGQVANGIATFLSRGF